MQKTSYYCDKCGKEFTLGFEEHANLEDGYINVHIPFIYKNYEKVDLCRTCFKELNKITQDYSITLLDFVGYRNKNFLKEKEIKDISSKTLIEWGRK